MPQKAKELYRNYRDNGELKSITQLIDRDNDKNLIIVPKWVSILSLICSLLIIITLVTALAVVYFATRPGLHNESCVRRSCLKELNLKCINDTCQCESDYFYVRKCIPKKDYMEKCHLTSYCKNNVNMICKDGFCKCDSTKYWNGVLCTDKGSLGKTCQNDDQCLTDSMLYCDTKKGKCSCGITRYWDSTACVLKRTYTEYCNTLTECREWQNLYCINNLCQCDSVKYWDSSYGMCKNKLYENNTCTSSNQCYTPMDCTANGICQCNDTQYHDLTTLSCLPKKSINELCTVNFNCRVDKYLECKNGICKCLSNYPTWSVDRDKCILMSTYTQSCTYQSDCDYTKSLLCNTGTNCSCPTTSNFGKCDCPAPVIGAEYYWNGTDCVLAGSYLQSCKIGANYTCQTFKELTQCDSSGKCTCGPYGIWKSTKCVFCARNWYFYKGVCYSGSTQQIQLSWSSIDYSSGCYNEPTAVLGKLNDSDINSSFLNSLNSGTYYFNAFWLSGTLYESSDSSTRITYNPSTWCQSVQPKRCVVYDASNKCFEDRDCNNAKDYICEYIPY